MVQYREERHVQFTYFQKGKYDLRKMTYLLQRAAKEDILDELPIQRIYRHTTK